MELTLTADSFATLGKSIAEQLGAPLGSKVEISSQEDGSLRICTKDEKKERKRTLTAEELVRELERLVGHAKIASAPIEEIQQAIADGYVEHGMRGLR